MTGIKIVCVGRVKEDFFRDGIAAYVKEIRKKYGKQSKENCLFVCRDSFNSQVLVQDFQSY